MAAVAHANKKGMYSWWWDSHISPKNSKWLKENLTDMDMKVKQMIKLLEEDADSFARRAEMYYKKRPELMKLVEEFYRAYRALAERYDHATGVLRHAQKTMAEAFPNQVPLMLSDDSAPELDPQTPDISFASRNGGFSEDSDSINSKKGLKQFNSGQFGSGEGRVRRGLNFHDSNEKQDLRDEEEIASLKKDLARLEAEKEAGIVQYQRSLEESKKFSERVEQAEAEVRSLQESITRLEEEKNESLLKYQQCLDKIGEMENLTRESKERADRIEAEAEALKGDLVKLEAEKEAALGKYNECLEIISGLEEKLRKAEAEVESLKEELSKLLETISGLEHKLSLAEEETQRLRLDIDGRTEKLKISEERYLTLENLNQTLHSKLETRSRELVDKQNEVGSLWNCVQEERARFVEAETAFQTLQHLHSQSLEELRSLAVDIQSRNQILKDMEAQNQNLHGEVERILDENRNLNEVNLSSSLTVKNLQEEILSLREMIQKLEQEIELRVDERNALQQEIYCLKEEVNGLNEKNRGLEEQVDSKTSEKVVLLEKLVVMEKLIEKNLLLENSLCDLNVELEEVREKVKALEESCKTLLGEKDSLNSQLNIMTQKYEKLEEKNNLLENSLCDANAEAEALRVKSKSLEDSCLSLGEEKSSLVAERDSLVSLLNVSQESMKDLEKRFQELEEIHAFVEREKESILFEMDKLNKTLNAEREESSGIIKSSKAQICDMESQILLLQQEAASRNNEYEEELDKNIHFQTEIFILQKSMKELKGTILSLSFNCQKLVETTNHSEKQISRLENRNLEQQVELKALTDQLNELSLWLYEVFGILDINTKHGFEHKMEGETIEQIIQKVKEMQTEIFILQKCMKESEEKISALSLNCQKLVDASHNSEKQISHLESKNLEQQVELKSLTDHINKLRLGLYEVFRVLKNGSVHKTEIDQEVGGLIISKVKELQNSLAKVEEENLLGAIEKSILDTLLRRTEAEAADLWAEKCALDQNIRDQTEQLLSLQRELEIVLQTSEELRLKVLEGICREEVLNSEMKILHEQLTSTGAAFERLKEENCAVLKEKNWLEEEGHIMLGEKLSRATASVILEEVVRQNFVALKELVQELEKVHSVNGKLHKKIILMEGNLENIQVEKLELKGLLEKSENEVKSVTSVNKQLNCEITKGKEMLGQFEKKLSEATETINVSENKKHELEKELEVLKEEYGSVFEKLIVSEVREMLFEEKIHECEDELEKKLSEAAETINVTENKKCELEKELVVLKEEYGSLLGKVIVSEVREMLFEEKIHESEYELEKKLSEAAETISITENKKCEVEKELLVLKEEYGSVLGKSIVSEVREMLFEEKIHETEYELEKKLSEAAETMNVTENKKCEVEKELLVLKEEYGSVLGKLIVSEVREMLYEEKIHEIEYELEKKLSEAAETMNVTENKKCEVEKELLVLKEEYGSVLGKLIVSEVREMLYEEKIHETEYELEKKLSEAAETMNVTENKKCELENELRVLKEGYGSVLGKLIVSEIREMLFEEKIRVCVDQLEKKLSEAAETITVAENEKCEVEKELLALKEEYGSVLGKLIVSEVRELLFEEKIHECEDELEKIRESKRMEMEILEKKAGTVEGEKGDLNAKLAAHLLALASLRDCVVSLESSFKKDKQNRAAAPGVEDLESAHDLERRLKAIETALLEKLARLEGPTSSPMPETAAGEGRALTKDIMLDQASECSSYGISRRGTLGPDDHQVLELWDTDRGSKLGFDALKEHRSLNPSTDSLADKMDFSETFSDTQSASGGKRRVKVLERLDSDVQKLMNLQITLEDLKRKVEAMERNKKGEMGKGKGFEYDALKGQLNEVEAAITKLFNENRRLAKNLEEDPDEIDGTGVSRRRFSEQARRGSERLGRIQLELQRIQFLLLKLENGSESKERSKVIDERSKRVLLRDYLYGSGPRTHNRTDPKRKKAHFCACAPKVIE